MQVIGAISGDGKVVVRDSRAPDGAVLPVDLDLEHVLGDMPNKTYSFTRQTVSPQPLSLPQEELSPMAVLHTVLRLPAVGSKRFLTTKVDRCVTGELCRLQQVLSGCKLCMAGHAANTVMTLVLARASLGLNVGRGNASAGQRLL